MKADLLRRVKGFACDMEAMVEHTRPTTSSSTALVTGKPGLLSAMPIREEGGLIYCQHSFLFTCFMFLSLDNIRQHPTWALWGAGW